MDLTQQNHIELKQTLESNASDLHNAAASLGRFVERHKKDSGKNLSATESVDVPLVRNIKLNSTQNKLKTNKVDSANNNISALSTSASFSSSKTSNGLSTVNNNLENIENATKKLNEAHEFKLKGNQYLKLNKFKEAIIQYSNAIELNNADPVFYCNRARCYLNLENYEKCIEDCLLSLKIDEKYVKAYYCRMQANEYLGNNEEALMDCEKILQLDPKNQNTLACCKRLQQRINAKKNERQIPKNNEPSKEQVQENHILDNTSSKTTESPSTSGIDEKTTANSYKNLGNDCVKQEKFDKAVMYYTQAIKIYDSNAIFYCNRAFCHLKLCRYNQCVTDCDMAIQLDRKFVKAYFRRMCAYEALEKYLNAFNDCNNVLSLEPKNIDAITSYQRIVNKLSKNYVQKQKIILKQRPGLNGTTIQFIQKLPHTRSNRPLKPIKIVEEEKMPVPIPNTHEENFNKSFDSSKREIKQDVPNETIVTTQIITPKSDNKVDILKIPSQPTTSAQFHNIWKEMTDLKSKYLFLKKININQLNKLLGALFDSKILSELLEILSTYYILDNQPIQHILREIGKNNEFNILKMLMGDEDKKEFEKIITYLKAKSNDLEEVTFIMKLFAFDSA